jgi:hypothetical protein
MRPADAYRRIADNPFYVLGLGIESSRIEVEREGQKLLSMLELGLRAAGEYQTPLGPRIRTPEKVREAMAELRDPQRRLVHELWARLPATGAPAPAADGDADVRDEGAAVIWGDALVALGWGRR